MIEIYLENAKQNTLPRCCPLIAGLHVAKAPFHSITTRSCPKARSSRIKPILGNELHYGQDQQLAVSPFNRYSTNSEECETFQVFW